MLSHHQPIPPPTLSTFLWILYVKETSDAIAQLSSLDISVALRPHTTLSCPFRKIVWRAWINLMWYIESIAQSVL